MKLGHRQGGLSYLEVLISTVIISIALVPALDALSIGIMGSDQHVSQVRNQAQLVAKMEQTLATDYADLLAQADAVADATIAIPSPFSDTTGSSDRRLVYLARYDGDNVDGDNNPFTGTDNGLLWIKVELEGRSQSLETLIHE